MPTYNLSFQVLKEEKATPAMGVWLGSIRERLRQSTIGIAAQIIGLASWEITQSAENFLCLYLCLYLYLYLNFH